MEKKLRFGDLVRNAGRPQVVTLWTDPKRDRSFTRAIQQNRVLTVLRKPTTKRTDFGTIGFHREPQAIYLVFPRPLPQNQDSRVIGINYQLLDEPEAPPKQQAPLKQKKPPTAPKPVKKPFMVRVRRTATLDTHIEVEAENRKAAESEAMNSLRSLPFDLEQAAMRDEIVGVE